MPGRGAGRGRGGRGGATNYRLASRNDRESIHDRLGRQVVANDRTQARKFKFVRQATVTSSIAPLPPETRVRMLSKRFLKTYYEIFDQPGRLNLESQYSSDAFFSFSATYPMPTFGRNLLEVREPENRVSLLVHDKTNIARALATFSSTEHMINYLSSDVPFYIVNPMSIISMQIVVNGVFKDTSQTTNPLKAFTRVFVLKLVSIDSQGEPVYEIFNDLFMLQPPTPEQIKRYHQDSQIVKRLQERSETVATTRTHTSVASTVPKNQEEMIRSIMTKTRMNREGSKYLLTECNWDENHSMELFNRLAAAGPDQIPQHFFGP